MRSRMQKRQTQQTHQRRLKVVILGGEANIFHPFTPRLVILSQLLHRRASYVCQPSSVM